MNTFNDRLTETVRAARLGGPDVGEIARRGRARRVRRKVTTGLGTVVALAVVALPLSALSRFGEGAGQGVSASAPIVAEKAVVTDRLEIAAFPNAVVTGLGSAWAAAPNESSEGGSVIRIDPATAEIQAEIPVDHLPGWNWGSAGMAVGLGDVWITSAAAARDGDPSNGCCIATVERIDAATNTVAASFDAGPGYGEDIWIEGDEVWVLRRDPEGDGNAMSAVRIDPETGDILTEIAVPLVWSQSILVSGGDLYVFGDDDGSDGIAPDRVVRIDRSAGSVIDVSRGCALAVTTNVAAVDCGLGPSWISDGDGGYWILDTRGTDKQYRHVTPDGDVDRVIDASGDPDLRGGQHMAYDAATDTFWFAQFKDVLVRVAVEST